MTRRAKLRHRRRNVAARRAVYGGPWWVLSDVHYGSMMRYVSPETYATLAAAYGVGQGDSTP